MKRLLVILLSVSLALAAAAKRQKTGPGRLTRQAVEQPAPEVLYDTIRPGAVRCSGYDKPNSATRETFFVTNLDSIDIAGVAVEFDYFDAQDRQLHRAAHTVIIDIPAGQTRSVSVPAWDRNHAFHYYLSGAPARRRSAPFKVKSTVSYVLRRR